MRFHVARMAALSLSLSALFAACVPASPDDEKADGADHDQSGLEGPVCLGSQAGKYCGNDEMRDADASTLYDCPGPNMTPTGMQPCAGGCVVAPPGTADYCGDASPVCLGASPGKYCGNDEMTGADASTLYDCPGPNMAPTSQVKCAEGCVVAPPGTADYCKAGGEGAYRLPWPAGTWMQLTQDCNDSCCSDHVGNDRYAWDFANGGAFPVVAARAGTVTHLKINSTNGCGEKSCVNDANLIVIDHGDGTQALYMHLEGFSLASGVTCGGYVEQGQALATAGTTGWSTGIHLHFEVSEVHQGAAACECGADGEGCAADEVPWSSFWPSATDPTVAIAFDEWPAASECDDRRGEMPASQN